MALLLRAMIVVTLFTISKTQAVELTRKSFTVITGSSNTVADVLESGHRNLPVAAASMKIASAPATGAARIVNQPQILAAIETAAPGYVSKIELLGPTSCRVERLARTHEANDLAKSARHHLEKELGERYREFSIEQGSALRNLNLPAGEISYEPWMRETEKISARMRVWVDVLVDGEKFAVVPVWFTAKSSQMVPVVDATWSKGSTIDFHHIKMMYQEVDELNGVPIASLPSLIGKQLTRNVVPGEVITQGDVRTEPPIPASEEITVIAKAENIVIKSLAVARADGELNESIPVLNPKSGEQFVAKVVQKNHVEVSADE